MDNLNENKDGRLKVNANLRSRKHNNSIPRCPSDRKFAPR